VVEEIFGLSIHRDQLYKQVADQIQELIVTESLRPGDKLPSERELAERLGISRTVVREAIRTLSVRGLVRVKPGCGTYIQELSPKHAMAPIELLFKLRQTAGSLENLYEVRRTLEVEIAGLAAERAQEQDLAALEATIDGMVASAADSEKSAEYDLAFHTALAAAAHNDLFSILLGLTANLWRDVIRLSHQVPRATEDGVYHHRNILKWVRKRDPQRAREAMLAHIRHSQWQVETASKQTEQQENVESTDG